jgi:hypothetical protein
LKELERSPEMSKIFSAVAPTAAVADYLAWRADNPR